MSDVTRREAFKVAAVAGAAVAVGTTAQAAEPHRGHDEQTQKLLAEIPEVKELPAGVVRGALYTHFAKKKTLKQIGGELHGNWQQSFTGACIIDWDAWIDKNAIVSLKPAGKCAEAPHDEIVIAEHN